MQLKEHLKSFYDGRRVLVTGSHGFIGSHLCSELRGLGANLAYLDLKCDLDVTRIKDVSDLLPGVQTVFHLAAETEVNRSLLDPYHTYRTNVLGTLNVLEACRRERTRDVIIASTDKVYGPHMFPPEEGSPFRPNPSPYGQSKAGADRLCSDYARLYNVRVRTVRCTNVYGPGQYNRTTLIASAALSGLKGERPKVSERNPVREWLYIDDAVRAYLEIGALDNYQTSYNVGSGERLNCEQVVRAVLGELGVDPNGYETVPSGITDYPQYVDSTKLKTWVKDWNPTLFPYGIKTTVQWYRDEFEKGAFA